MAIPVIYGGEPQVPTGFSRVMMLRVGNIEPPHVACLHGDGRPRMAGKLRNRGLHQAAPFAASSAGCGELRQ